MVVLGLLSTKKSIQHPRKKIKLSNSRSLSSKKGEVVGQGEGTIF